MIRIFPVVGANARGHALIHFRFVERTTNDAATCYYRPGGRLIAALLSAGFDVNHLSFAEIVFAPAAR